MQLGQVLDMPYQDELLVGRMVSIWVGNLDTADDVAEYFGQPFERDFGFLLDQEDLPEIANSPKRGPSISLRNPPLDLVNIRKLIDAFAWSEDWMNEVARACQRQGIDTAKLMVAFPHLNYPPELCRNTEAPLRFIGNFPWPGGRDDWQARNETQIIHPPFPILRRDSSSWIGRVHLEAWRGFATRESLTDEFMSFRFSAKPEGDLGLEVSASDKRGNGVTPTHAQARAFQHLLDNQKTLRDAVLNGIFAAYDNWRESYIADEMLSENMPKLSDSRDLVHIIKPSTVYVLANEKEGFTHVGFSFSCKWDEEHALGVLTHKGIVVDVGQAETAFTDKHDNGV